MLRLVILILSTLLLTACSMQAMSEKLIPADVRPVIEAQTDALLRGDTDFIFQAFPDERDNPAFREQITRMASNVPDGPVISKHIVGVQARTAQSYSETQGATRTGTYNLAQEVEFANGFLLIQTAHTLDDDGNCCLLRAINASRHDTSPMRADQRRRARLFKILGGLTLITTLGTIIFLIVRIGGRKAREKQMGGSDG